MSTIAEIATMLQNKILPIVLASLPHIETAYDQIPTAPDYDRVGTTNTVRVPRNINTYTVNTLADGATVTPEVNTTDFIDITATRKYVSEEISHGMSVQALAEWFPTVLSNMLESLYVDAVTTGYAAISGTAGIGSVGVDNVAITRDVIQEAVAILDEADIPALDRCVSFSPTSKNDVASIADYNRAFSRNGNIPAESVPNVAGMAVKVTPASTMPPGASGVENLAFWLPAVSRVHLDETPNIMSERNVVMEPVNYRGLKVMLWMEEISGSLGGVRVSMSSTAGLGVVRETGVVQVLGR